MFPNPINSTPPDPLAEALAIAARGYSVFKAQNDRWVREDKESATRDLATIRRWAETEPEAGRILRTEARDGLHCVKINSPEGVGLLESDFGPLPRTWTISRDGGQAFFIFACSRRDPAFTMNAKVINGVKARMAYAAPLPGTRYKTSNEIWRWRHAPGDCCLAFLPPAWIRGLPKRRPAARTTKPDAGITATVISRPEWTPQCSDEFTTWGDYE